MPGTEPTLVTITEDTDVTPLLLATLVHHAADAAALAAHSAWRHPDLRQMLAEASGVFDAVAHYSGLTNPNERIRGHLDELNRLQSKLNGRFGRPLPDDEEE